MAATDWRTSNINIRGNVRNGGKLALLALAGIAAAAWANRDKIMAKVEKRRASATSAATAGAASVAWRGTGAHRADGSDDSASFGAGIADEGTIPNAPGTCAGSVWAGPHGQGVLIRA